MANPVAKALFSPMNWAHRKWVWPQRMEGLVRMVQPRLRAGDRVLDVGCGNGEFGKLLMEHPTSPEGLEFRGVEPEGLVRDGTAIPVSAFDGVRLPFDDGAFDVVLLTDVLHHAAEPGPLLAECVRVARRRVIVKDHVVYGSWDRKRLGFSEQIMGDVWSHRYAVVSDGDICIGLHDRVFDAPSLTFVQHDLAKRARKMSDAGLDFSFMKLDEDVFNEIGFTDRDGHPVTMLEARTFSWQDEEPDDSLCGRFIELTLPVRDAIRAGGFWAPLVPALSSMREEPTTHMRLDADGTAIGLSESIAVKNPSLSFRCEDRSPLAGHIEQHGISHALHPGFEGAFVEIVAPEGTSLFVFDEDFLGESYIVSEGEEDA